MKFTTTNKQTKFIIHFVSGCWKIYLQATKSKKNCYFLLWFNMVVVFLLLLLLCFSLFLIFFNVYHHASLFFSLSVCFYPISLINRLIFDVHCCGCCLWVNRYVSTGFKWTFHVLRLYGAMSLTFMLSQMLLQLNSPQHELCKRKTNGFSNFEKKSIW